MTSRPTRLVIGGYSYAVEDGRGLIRTEGEHWRTRGRIVLDPVLDASPDRQREVLVHEILHAIRDNGGHDEETEVDPDDHKEHMREVENFICSVDWGLVEALRANPDLVAYLVARE